MIVIVAEGFVGNRGRWAFPGSLVAFLGGHERMVVLHAAGRAPGAGHGGKSADAIMEAARSLFTFLERLEVPATNNLERQLRLAVIARKISCGNKTEQGARAWAVLASLAVTCRQTGRCVINDVSSRVLLQPVRGP